MSLLPQLSPLAAILLVVSLAYLRLETFRYRERIKKCASESLQQLSREGDWKPQQYGNTDYYGELAYLAGIPGGEGVEDSMRARWRMLPFFDSSWLRRFSVFGAGSALVLVITAAAHATGQWQGIEFMFTTEHIGWAFYGLSVLTASFVLLVLVGETYVSHAEEKIRKIAEEFGKHLKNPASEAVIGGEPPGV